jgi:hypothetical protein
MSFNTDIAALMATIAAIIFIVDYFHNLIIKKRTYHN